MASRRPRTSQGISLFPFLAVLVCMMGALIFLLLVTTTRIRAESVARALEQLVPVEELPDLAPAPIEAPRRLPVEPEEGLEIYESPDLPPEPVVVEEPVDNSRQAAALAAAWSNKVDELSRQREERLRQLAQRRLLADAAARKVVALQEEISRLEAELTAATRKLEAAESQPVSEADRRLIEQQILALRERLKNARQQESGGGKFSVVPVDPISGTSRRPILIECTKDGLRFLPEDIELTAADLAGFPERANPLLAGTAALVNYWLDKDRREPGGKPAAEPYVLLLVRPEGTVGYYVAMQLLASLKTQHGYELLDADTALQPPPVDPAARDACQNAINLLLAERERIIGSARGVRGGGVLDESRAKSGGGFEVNDVLGERKSSDVGSRSWENVDRFQGRENRAPRELKPGEAAPLPSPEDAGRKVIEIPAGGRPNSSPSPEQESLAPRGPSLGRSSSKTKPGDDMNLEQLSTRRWGQSDASASITMEREVIVRVDSDEMVIGKQTLKVGRGESANQLLGAVLQGVEEEIQTWGRPPRGFFFRPALKFVINPGGNQHVDRLDPLLEKSGLSVTRKFSFEAADSRLPEVSR